MAVVSRARCAVCGTSTGEFSHTCACGALVDALPPRPYARYAHETIPVTSLVGRNAESRAQYLEADLRAWNAYTAAVVANYRGSTRRERLRWWVDRVRAVVGFWIAGYDPREDR